MSLYLFACIPPRSPFLSLLLFLYLSLTAVSFKNDWTALRMAAESNRLETVKILLDGGANPGLANTKVKNKGCLFQNFFSYSILLLVFGLTVI